MPKGLLRHISMTGLLALLLITLSACSTTGPGLATSNSSHIASSGSDNSSASDMLVALSNQASSGTTTSGVIQSAYSAPLACNAGTKQGWDKFLHTQPGINSVESVTCAHLKGDASSQALVLVRNDGTGYILNAYIYEVLTVSGHPARQLLFKVEGLYKGSARISKVNTLTTGEADLSSRGNRNIPNAGIAPDVYREFKWSPSKHTFVQVLFPGIFPDLTRFQAESDQEQVAVQGHQPWKLNVLLTAKAFVDGLNNAPAPGSTQATIISGSNTGPNAIVKVRSGHPGSNPIFLTMTRLNGYANGIWIITRVQTHGMSIDTPAPLSHLTSPIQAKGQGNAFEGIIGELVVQDRIDPSIGVIGRVSAHVTPGANGMGHSTFNTSVPYSFSAQKSGISAEEGTLALYSRNEADGSISGAYIVKVLLS